MLLEVLSPYLLYPQLPEFFGCRALREGSNIGGSSPAMFKLAAAGGPVLANLTRGCPLP